ncbi:hypothetical protein FAZ19_16305 [Sphingobacterium alkalisoli]|uniref:Peptidase S74 domain-containing protein n=1 Tax=Sphingobacterium alkalisoli TaxID=1874115 RepID=A0A4V5LXT2_9SPHI|nr:hypothetical protein [Sphingobacterium alkalisoli]TJY63829.1 hypothetical protein FAZ19_16305 [Sphingobacterium alkalisoli]GGH24614.1 hypothetical protein GCM10011418_32650 [Sphingobacterium alkalisoli]
MKYILIIMMLFGVAFGQTQGSLPTGSVPYSTNLFKSPDGLIWTGKAGSYTNIGSKEDYDALISAGYTNAQIDSIALDVYTRARARANHTGTQAISTVSGLQAALDAKQATITGGASTITTANLTANRALISDASGKVTVSAVTNTQLGYLTGVTSAIQTQLNNKINSSEKGAVNGVATLGADGKLPAGQLPSIAITETFVVSSQAQMLALAAEIGDVAVRNDIDKSFILQASPATTLANWIELLSPSVDNTDQIPEGSTNLYFTQARARASLSAGTGIGYNSSTGVISNTSPNLPSNLAVGSRTTTTVPITNSDGTGVTIPVSSTTLAGVMSSTDKVKLDGIATGATVNSTDAQLRDRATHTGVQAISTVTGLQTSLDSKEAVANKATSLASANNTTYPTTLAVSNAITAATPTVNNGTLTMSTGAGLTGSSTFTANQSGNSTFSVGVDALGVEEVSAGKVMTSGYLGIGVNGLSRGSAIPPKDQLSNLGVYTYGQGFLGDDTIPITSAFKMLNVGHTAWSSQLLFNSYQNEMWIRSRTSSNGAFRPWTKIASEDYVNSQIPAPQTLTAQPSGTGSISISSGNTITLNSLRSTDSPDADVKPVSSAGLSVFTNTTGSTNYPSTLGGGLTFHRSGDSNNLGAFQLWKNSNSENVLRFRGGSGTGTWNPWVVLADRDWVSTQIPSPQTLSVGPTAGRIDISGGNSVALSSLLPNPVTTFPDASVIAPAGFYPYNTTSGSVGYPVAAGGGFKYSRAGGGSALGDFDLFKSATDEGNVLYLRSGISTTAYTPFEILATRPWVESFGIGRGVENNSVFVGDLKEISTTGIYRYSNSSTNIPSTLNGHILNIFRLGSAVARLALDDASDLHFNFGPNTTDPTWRRMWSTKHFTQTEVDKWNGYDTRFVDLTTTQSIGGIKTFTNNPVVRPSAASGAILDLRGNDTGDGTAYVRFQGKAIGNQIGYVGKPSPTTDNITLFNSLTTSGVQVSGSSPEVDLRTNNASRLLVSNTAISATVGISGTTATFSGNVNSNPAPTVGGHLTNKTYVDTKLSLNGGTLTGSFNIVQASPSAGTINITGGNGTQGSARINFRNRADASISGFVGKASAESNDISLQNLKSSSSIELAESSPQIKLTAGGVNAMSVSNTDITITAPLSGTSASFSGNISSITPPTSAGHLTNKTYVDAQSVIEALNEGNGIGYRLRSSNPAYFGDIGLGAIDFSRSVAVSNTYGATGISSFAAGYNSTASGTSSVALGENNISSGQGSVSTGISNSATSSGSANIGGQGNSATHLRSVTVGGVGLVSGSSQQTLVGQYNAPSSFGLFVVGRGTNNDNRINAFEVNSSGNATVEGNLTTAQYRLSSLNTAPISATATGSTGEIRITSTHIYVCVATNTWVRSALTTW